MPQNLSPPLSAGHYAMERRYNIIDAEDLRVAKEDSERRMTPPEV
jgi:hypothetical protein